MMTSQTTSSRVTCSPEIRETKQIRYRNIKSIDPQTFTGEVANRWGGINKEESFGENVTRYTNVMSTLMNELAPELTKTIKIVPDSPW